MAKSRAEIMANLAKLAGGKTPAVTAAAPKAKAITKLEDLPTVGLDPDEDEDEEEEEIGEDVEEFETEQDDDDLDESAIEEAANADRTAQHEEVLAEFRDHLKKFIRFVEGNAEKLIDLLSE
jgi:hypothetical protein